MALTDTLRETLEVVRELGEASAKEIAEKLEISPSGVRKRLSKLVEEGFVKKIVDGKKVKFTVEEVEEVTENEEVEEVTENENAAEEENEDDLVDIYINGKYTISVEPERVDEVVKRCNPNAEFDHSEGNKRYYTIKSGSKG